MFEAVNQATALNKQTSDAPVHGKQTHARRFKLDSPTVLDERNLDECRLSKMEYKQQLEHYQKKLSQLGWQAHDARRSVVSVFEGWDAGGKDGAIRRVTRALDARLYRVISVAAPTDEERARHYLWRFWRQLPHDGYITIYDRSWYGRVLVERVEGLATEEEWMRSYQEINDFEEQQYLHGTILTKTGGTGTSGINMPLPSMTWSPVPAHARRPESSCRRTTSDMPVCPYANVLRQRWSNDHVPADDTVTSL